jgi:hypothetical protein
MNVTATRVIETCLDGTKNIEKTLDRTIDRKFIYHLAALGNLEYFADFSRPFFRITRPGEFIIKGVEGADSFEVFIVSALSDPDQEIAILIRRYHPAQES